MTKIEWTDETWNPVTGCTKVSAGCKNCYAERVFPRAYPRRCVCGHSLGIHQPKCLAGSMSRDPNAKLCECNTFRQRRFTDVQFHPDRLDAPLRWRKPRRVFVNSMSDLFHEDVTDEQIDQIFAVMALAPQHSFQCLTKRAERMRDYCSDPDTPGRVAKAADAITVAREIGRMGPEEIRPITDFPGYFITDRGRVLSSSGSSVCVFCGASVDGIATKMYCSKKCRQNAGYYRRTGRAREAQKGLAEMSPDSGAEGHLRVMLYRNGEQHRVLVHRLVLTAFVRVPQSQEQACHRNGDPRNNALPNLRWGSQSENWEDRIRHGNARSYAKLTRRQVDEIRGCRKALMSKEAVARRFGISATQVTNIERGDQWPDFHRWPLGNCWSGVSCEDQATADERIPLLLQTPAAVRFVSYEPALSHVNFNLSGINWLICGGESGPSARGFDLDWARSARNQCRESGTAFFFKQAGSAPYDSDLTRFGGSETRNYQDPKGGDPSEWPEDLRVREWPA